MKKGLLSFLTILIHQFLVAQNIELAIELKTISPFITKFNREQMIGILYDSVTASCSRQIESFTNEIHFFNRDQRAKLEVNYNLHLTVIDTIVSTANHKSVFFVLVDAAFNEANLPMDSLEWKRSGISYGYDSAKIKEEEAIKRLIAAT